MLVFSVHADTNFTHHALSRLEGGIVHGQLDNFVGVHTIMKAYFSGRMDKPWVRIELTHGEERGMAGAKEVAAGLDESDMVIVIDVTGVDSDKDFVIEKCESRKLRNFLNRALEGMDFDIYRGCEDPVAQADETDVYSDVTKYTCMLAIPVWGGDYNEEPVCCRDWTIDVVAEAVCRLAEAYPSFQA